MRARERGEGAHRALAPAAILAAVLVAGVAPRWDTPAVAAQAAQPASERTPAELARQLLSAVTPTDVEAALATTPEKAVPVLLALGRGLAEAEPALATELQQFAAEAAHLRAERLTRRGAPFSDEELETLLVMMLLDPPRFAADPEMRLRVVPILEGSLAPSASVELRDGLLLLLDRLRDFPFRYAERVQLAWGALERSSQPLRVPFVPSEMRPPEFDTPIAASVFSFPSPSIRPADAARFLRALHAVDPQRRLLVLADPAMMDELAPLAASQRLDLLPTWGRAYSPWVRDVLSFRYREDGGVVVVLRPDTQLARQQDAHLGQVLLQQLPQDLFARWNPVWTASTIPFHNGQILQTDGAAWVSVHTLRAHIRRLTGSVEPLGPTPVDDAAAAAYLEAARRGAEELEDLLALPVRFVHEVAGSAPAATLYSQLAGGASFDLDSLLTLLPGRDGLSALVGDLEAGRSLVMRLDLEELDRLGETYRLRSRGENLRRELLAGLAEPRSAALQDFLEQIVAKLGEDSISVERLPLLRVPVTLLERRFSHDDFLVSWNNVTLQRRDGALSAEGFASTIEAGDEIARSAFARAGYRLELLPPLIDSIIRNGGYRCASNHLRSPA